MMTGLVFYIIGFIINVDNFVCSYKRDKIDTETVLVTSSSNVKYIEVPTSDNPILTWMEVRKGTFPNITSDLSTVTNVTIGDPITLLIFYNDSNLYDITVTDCWAYDDEKFPLSKQKIHLSEELSNNTDKTLTKWKKFRFENFLSFLFASFISFKFPDKDKIFLTCDIKLIGREHI